ncbi:MAG: hypothetical protein LBC74_07645 [Planctomycetaceae bacterium]|jgi:hypothetical protein|nr:hypothetical protein [Planctomycetaceae bacterium]
MTTTSTSKQPKSWYKRKRFWFCVILVFLVYFCLVPSRSRISVETTGITDPLTVDGQVDYFALFEKTYIDKLLPPENNGQRLMIAACGLRVLEQNFLADTVQWEELPTHEYGKNWFNNYWIPLCEHLYIDPYCKPKFHAKRGFHSYMNKYFQEQQEAAGEKKNDNTIGDRTNAMFKKLTAATWKKEDYPEVGKWLDEYSEVLDYFGMCVRKPNFSCWRQKPANDSLISIVLPDVQANRSFIRDLAVRISERIGRGDIEGARYDLMSIKYLAQHYMNEPFFVINLVGVAANDSFTKSSKLLLANCSLTEKQLAEFSNDLDSLPKYYSPALTMLVEQSIPFQFLQYLKNKSWYKIFIADKYMDDFQDHYKLSIISRLPFDANIAGKHLTKLYNVSGLKGNKHIVSNPVLRRRYAERLEKSLMEIYEAIKINQFYRIPLIRTRSELLAEYLFCLLMPSINTAFTAFDYFDASNEMLRIAISLERYKLANGKYPDKLEALVPKYLDIVPIDPCTGRTTFVYKLRDTTKEKTTTNETPKSIELPFILYSLGPNTKDDGGITQTSKYQYNSKLDQDYVF